MDAKMKAGAKKLHPGAQNGPMQAPGRKNLELLTLQGRFLAPPGDPNITQKVVFQRKWRLQGSHFLDFCREDCGNQLFHRFFIDF